MPVAGLIRFAPLRAGSAQGSGGTETDGAIYAAAVPPEGRRALRQRL